MRRQLEMSGGARPHYKLEKPNSNFVLKYLFNAWRNNKGLNASACLYSHQGGLSREHQDALGARAAMVLELVGGRQTDDVA